MREMSLLYQVVIVGIGSMLILATLAQTEVQGMTQETSTPEQNTDVEDAVRRDS